MENELRKFAEASCDSYGEYCLSIINSYNLSKIYGSEEVQKVLKKEIDDLAKDFKENFRLIEKEHTITRKYLELEEIE